MGVFDYLQEKVEGAGSALLNGIITTLSGLVEGIGQDPDAAAGTMILLGFIGLMLFFFRSIGMKRRVMA